MIIEPDKGLGQEVIEMAEKAQTRDDGGSAYPSNCCRTIDCPGVYIDGMTLRDRFAGDAMQGLILKWSVQDFNLGDPESVSEMSYRFADAMLKERSK